MTIAWSEYEKFVRPDVSMAPSPTVRDAIRSAATEFLKITRFWHVPTLAAAVTSAQSAPRGVTITPPSGGKCWMPIWVNFHVGGSLTDFVALEPATPQELDACVPGWRASQDEVSSAPEFYLMRSEGVLVVAPWPDADGTVDVDMSFIPTAASTGCIDELFDLYYETIALGAKGRLLMMPGKSWTNMAEGVALLGAFRSMAASAEVREARGRSPALISTATLYR